MSSICEHCDRLHRGVLGGSTATRHAAKLSALKCACVGSGVCAVLLPQSGGKNALHSRRAHRAALNLANVAAMAPLSCRRALPTPLTPASGSTTPIPTAFLYDLPEPIITLDSSAVEAGEGIAGSSESSGCTNAPCMSSWLVRWRRPHVARAYLDIA